jgi:hypothetical protein
MKDLFKEACKIQAIHLKKLGIPLGEKLKEIEAEMTNEEKCEVEIKLIEAEYALQGINCKTCNDTGEIPANNYMPDNPDLIDRPYRICPDCGGTKKGIY